MRYLHCKSPRPPFIKGGKRGETMANKVPWFCIRSLGWQGWRSLYAKPLENPCKHIGSSVGAHRGWRRIGLWLVAATMAYNVLEGVLAVGAGLNAKRLPCPFWPR